MPPGQLELLTGISERRWWEPGYRVSQGAAAAGKKALAAADMTADEIDVLIYAGVCRENFEPATACAVADELKINPNATIFDLSQRLPGRAQRRSSRSPTGSNWGRRRPGWWCPRETAREINENVIDRMVRTKSVELFRECVATLTGGSGAVAVLVVSEELSRDKRRKLIGGVTQNAPQHHALCRWGLQSILPAAVGTVERVLGHNAAGLVQKGVGNAAGLVQKGVDLGLRHVMVPFMETHAGEVLKYGVELGNRTWQTFLTKFGWRPD